MKKKENIADKKNVETPKENYIDQYKDFDVTNIGDFITKIRKQRGLSQTDIANALFIDKRKVSRWETGKSIPETEMIPKIATLLNVSILELYASREYSRSFVEKFEKKIRNPKDILKITIRHKILFIIGILFGIFLGLTAVYTFNNYDTVEIYSLKSLDENFKLKGNYIRARDYQLFNITSLNYIGADKEKLNMDVYTVEYFVLSNNKQIIQMSNAKTLEYNQKNSINLLKSINNTSLIYERKFKKINERDNLILQITYRDEKSEMQNIYFKFKIYLEYNNR